MPCSGCSVLHGVNFFFFKKKHASFSVSSNHLKTRILNTNFQSKALRTSFSISSNHLKTRILNTNIQSKALHASFFISSNHQKTRMLNTNFQSKALHASFFMVQIAEEQFVDSFLANAQIV